MFENKDLLFYGKSKYSNGLLLAIDIVDSIEKGNFDRSYLFEKVKNLIIDLLEYAKEFSFCGDIIKCYFAFMLAIDENTFSLLFERKKTDCDVSIVEFAKSDISIIRKLFFYDFTKLDKIYNVNYFALFKNYISNNNNSIDNSLIIDFMKSLSQTNSDDEFLKEILHFYNKNGVGQFALYNSFRLSNDNDLMLCPILNNNKISFDDIIGYESQKDKLINNTKKFVSNLHCNNVLLYGDAGTGKSSCVEALLNKFCGSGLKIVEVYKHEFGLLNCLISYLKNRNYYFIIFFDDLSFEDSEDGYKYLKAIIEGGVDLIHNNILIYATSNRRHLIKESFKDKNDIEYIDDIYRSDTIEEKLSLQARFGLKINFNIPTRVEYNNIVLQLAKKEGINIADEELIKLATQFELRNGGISGRMARQFINSIDNGY